MARKIGSQTRETLEESGYKFVGYLSEDKATIVLQSTDGSQTEIWGLNNDHAGYTIEVDGMGHEFIRDYKASRDGLPFQETPPILKSEMSNYEGCTITNIKRGKKSQKRDHLIYAELRDKNGDLIISATLEYILEALKIRLPEQK